ncbi:hypothetical protein W97_08279 [Coniosporium apollinis CBS 100218]|uniref:Uncharacterized protein n=1 Tax=Coniosporium apollinis (strain CBS 100218) TaxID=1168221 RepID=R7Z513_CONA1|nr:uncharacterized protein W97_08279 [Coniosporium apollinis CBS 100218]EON69021.1 hypothetical protein W97_08279 [Coniosporium apollinis CBS 100218]
MSSTAAPVLTHEATLDALRAEAAKAVTVQSNSAVDTSTNAPADASPDARPRRDSTFLALAPTQSNSFPASPPSMSPRNSVAAVDAVEPALGMETKRRSSSVSSGEAGRARFLKLGPVHYGGEMGVSDYAEQEE